VYIYPRHQADQSRLLCSGRNGRGLSISVVCKRRPQKTSSLFAAIDDAPSSSAPTPARQYVAEFDPSQTLTPAVAPVVIVPLPNSGIFGRRKPSPLLAVQSAAAAGLHAFDLDTATSTAAAADPSSSTHYGLTRRNAADASDRGTDEFRDMPVEGFGAAILAGYGLIVTKGEDTKVAHRGARHGLGYNPSEPDKDCKKV
jgi:G patch domain/KOW motif-containing protein